MHAVEIFQNIIIKLLPLYGVMGLGFWFGRLQPTAAQPMSFLLIYFVTPLVISTSLANLPFQPAYLLLPCVTFGLCSIVAVLTYQIARQRWRDNLPNLLAYACALANTGYYGVPIALILFASELLGLFMMALVGFALFENTFGYYLIARGQFSARDALRKLLRLPTLYAFLLGATCSVLAWRVPAFAIDIVRDLRGAYVVLGALIIGIGLARLTRLRMDWAALTLGFSIKFMLWPALTLVFTTLDAQLFHFFMPAIHKILLLMAILPMPANAIAFAIQLNVQPDKATSMVFLSTVFALLYIPLVMLWWG